MIAGPEILSAIFLATSESWRSNSAAFASGAAVSITTIVILLVRDWMNDNSWVVSEIVIGLFVVITLSGIDG